MYMNDRENKQIEIYLHFEIHFQLSENAAFVSLSWYLLQGEVPFSTYVKKGISPCTRLCMYGTTYLIRTKNDPLSEFGASLPHCVMASSHLG